MSIAKSMFAPAVVSQVKSVLLATVIALLVWVFAEGESLATRTVSAAVQFPGDAGAGTDLVVIPDDPNFRGEARVRLEGTLRSLDIAAGEIGGRVRLAPGSPGLPNGPGEKLVADLAQAIGALPGLKGLGSSVAEVEPRQVVVRAVRMVQREVPVRVVLGADVPLDGDPAPTPDRVSVRVPEAAAAQLPDAVEARVSEAEIRRLRAEGPQTVPAQVVPPPSLFGVRPMGLSHDTVSVSLRVRRRIETVTLQGVPVWFSLPPTEDTARWSVDVQDKFLGDVTLSGPLEEIRRIDARAVPVKALIELSSEDLEHGAAGLTKTAAFPGLPPGVTAAAATPGVRVRVTRRENGAAGR